MINLAELAKRAEELYRDVECSFGVVRVYHVPDAVLLSVSVEIPEPERPTVSMRTVTGIQERPAKKGDKAYDEWLKDKARYDAEMLNVRAAMATVMALQDIEYPADISKPPNKMAAAIYKDNYPENEILRKKIWLDFTVLTIRDDKNKILAALNAMNGENEPTEEMVEEVKKNSA